MSVDNHLEAFGYTTVGIIIKSGQSGEPSKKIENNFLSALPKASCASLSMKQRDETYRYFPDLGVYYGYMDKEGVKSVQDIKEAEVHFPIQNSSWKVSSRPIQDCSLIPPVNPPQPVNLGGFVGAAPWGLDMLGVADLWKQGLTGKGVKVAHADTGVNDQHKALQGKVKGWIDTDTDPSLEGGQIKPDSKTPYDDQVDMWHGTHTAGIICGGKVDPGMAIGVAPDSYLYSAKVIEGGNINSRIFTAFQWFIDKGCRVLSMSIGEPINDPWWESHVMNRLVEKGIVPCVAVGNEGPNTIRTPGGSPSTFTVGAIDFQQNVADFSSSITLGSRKKPDVVAPGVDVWSANGGPNLKTHPVQSLSGTSMATPHVAGTVAILLQAYPNATVRQIVQALGSDSTCKTPDWPANSGQPPHPERYGHGLIVPEKALAALKSILS